MSETEDLVSSVKILSPRFKKFKKKRNSERKMACISFFTARNSNLEKKETSVMEKEDSSAGPGVHRTVFSNYFHPNRPS